MTTQRLATPQALADLRSSSVVDLRSGPDRANPFVLWGFVVMFLGVAIGVVGKLLLHADIVTVVGVLLALAGIFLVVYPYLRPTRRKIGDSSFSSLPEALTPSQRTEYLPDASSTEFVPSITERTTDLLKNPATRHDQNRSQKTGDLK